jgi:hypothetical protein
MFTQVDQRRELWSPSVQLSAEGAADFGRKPMVASHNLDQSELFSDAALIELLDRFPRGNLYAMTTGGDPRRPEENRLARNESVSGAGLLRAVKKARLWLNLTRIDRAEERFRWLLDRLYAQLAAAVPGFRPDLTQANLLISSPHAVVYYHVDGPASVLWHVRGRKRVWVYPAGDTHYVQREALEDIFAGVRHEYLPFESSFYRGATVFDLEPGQWMVWAHNAPHRVTNLEGLNVSLTSEHFTRETRRRAHVYVANRFFRTHLGLSGLSTRERGPGALLKTVSHRLARRAGLDPTPPKRHVAALRVDPDAPDGVVALAHTDTPFTAPA